MPGGQGRAVRCFGCVCAAAAAENAELRMALPNSRRSMGVFISGSISRHGGHRRARHALSFDRDHMTEDAFDLIDQALRSGGPAAGFDLLADKVLADKNYPLLFEVRLLKKRHELGLPLIQVDDSAAMAPDTRREYDKAFMDAAREVGGLFLADGNIQRASPYFRAIGETSPVAAAIDKFDSQEGFEPIIEIAYMERVSPYKGFQMILSNYGICRAITSFGQFPAREGRDESLRLLVRTLHSELVESLKRVIAKNEDKAPDTRSVPELMAGRDWLFEGHSYYVDTSHLISVVRFSLDLNDREM